MWTPAQTKAYACTALVMAFIMPLIFHYGGPYWLDVTGIFVCTMILHFIWKGAYAFYVRFIKKV